MEKRKLNEEEREIALSIYRATVCAYEYAAEPGRYKAIADELRGVLKNFDRLAQATLADDVEDVAVLGNN